MNIAELRFFDNTRLSSFKTCARKFYFEHVRHWRPDRKSVALSFGGAWHAAMDSCWKSLAEGYTKSLVIDAAYKAFVEHWVEEGLPHPDALSPDELADMTPRTPMIAREMLHAYIDARVHLFSDPSFKLIDVERPFAVPLDPNDPSLWYVGRLDKVFGYRTNFFVMEHKTTTSYRKNGPFRADFLDSFSPNSQIDGYLFALRMAYGDKAAGVWIDAALVHKEVHDGFKILPVDRQHAMIDSWLWEARNYIDQIEGNLEALAERAEDDTPYLAAFPKNTSSCSQYGGCPFADLCKTLANPAKQVDPPLGYKIERWDPLAHIDLTKIGFSVPTSVKEPA